MICRRRSCQPHLARHDAAAGDVIDADVAGSRSIRDAPPSRSRSTHRLADECAGAGRRVPPHDRMTTAHRLRFHGCCCGDVRCRHRVAQPSLCIPKHLPRRRGRLIVIGAARLLRPCASRGGSLAGPLSGLVVTLRLCSALSTCRDAESAHPVPTPQGSLRERMLDLVKNLNDDDLVLCLISGGGSALLPLPAPGSRWKSNKR